MKREHGSWRKGVSPANLQIKCIVICKHCGNNVPRPVTKNTLSKRQTFFCNHRCQINWQNKNTQFNKGINNPSYTNGERVGGKLPKYGDDFTSKLRRLVKIRDGYNCQKCTTNFSGKKSKLLDVHHIDHDKYNNELSNLTCLCKSCHTKVHWIEDKL